MAAPIQLYPNMNLALVEALDAAVLVINDARRHIPVEMFEDPSVVRELEILIRGSEQTSECLSHMRDAARRLERVIRRGKSHA